MKLARLDVRHGSPRKALTLVLVDEDDDAEKTILFEKGPEKKEGKEKKEKELKKHQEVKEVDEKEDDIEGHSRSHPRLHLLFLISHRRGRGRKGGRD